MGKRACKKRSGLSLTLAAICLAGWLTACADPEDAAEPDEIVIGVIAPVASGFFRSGLATSEGALLAEKEINAGGGVATGTTRRPFRLAVEDTDDRPETAVSKAFKLISSDRASVLVGLPVSDSALAVAKVAEEHRIPMISTTSSNPETTRGKRFVFRAIFDDSYQARILAEFAFRSLGARKAAILFDPGSAYSQGFEQVFRRVFEKSGGEVAARESYTADDRDASDRLRRVRESGADLLVVPVYPALLTTLMPQVRDFGLAAPAVGGDSWGPLAAAERVGWSPAYFSDVWTPDSSSDRSRRFVEAYRESYGKSPTSYAALAYDAVFLVAHAIERQGAADPEAIRAGLAGLDDFTGVTGAIRFPESGTPVRSAVIMRVGGDGSARLHKRFDP